MKCIKGYDVAPQRSGSGLYYMGTVDEEGYANCRLSSTYAKTAEQAKSLPLDRQNAMENAFCNQCGRCFNVEV